MGKKVNIDERVFSRYARVEDILHHYREYLFYIDDESFMNEFENAQWMSKSIKRKVKNFFKRHYDK